MKKSLMTLAVLAMAVGVAGWAVGQDKKDTTARGGRGSLPPGWSKLGLSDEQKQRIYSTQGEFRTKIRDLQRQISQLEKQERGEVYKLLTDAQKARLKELVTEKISGEPAPKEDKKPPSGGEAPKKP